MVNQDSFMSSVIQYVYDQKLPHEKLTYCHRAL